MVAVLRGVVVGRPAYESSGTRWKLKKPARCIIVRYVHVSTDSSMQSS
jgi:hypothetical protein